MSLLAVRCSASASAISLADSETSPMVCWMRAMASCISAVSASPLLTRRTLCQFAYLIRHHGKTAAQVAGTRRFNGGIQRQQVGLVGHVTNDVQHADNGLALLRQRGHLLLAVAYGLTDGVDFLQGGINHARAVAGDGACLAGALLGDFRAVGNMGDAD